MEINIVGRFDDPRIIGNDFLAALKPLAEEVIEHDNDYPKESIIYGPASFECKGTKIGEKVYDIKVELTNNYPEAHRLLDKADIALLDFGFDEYGYQILAEKIKECREKGKIVVTSVNIFKAKEELFYALEEFINKENQTSN